MSVTIQADENIQRSITDGIEEKGISVYRVEDESGKGRGDRDLLRTARAKERVMLTNDTDFLDIDIPASYS